MSPSRFTLPTFRNPQLLNQALTHTSYLNEHPGELGDNQRLEFIGDAVLGHLCGEWLYDHPCLTNASEGQLTALRATLVRQETLAQFATLTDIPNLLKLGQGEDTNEGRRNAKNLCAAFEAVVGAFYRDQGIEATRQFVYQFFERVEDLAAMLQGHGCKDSKTRLKEYCDREKLQVTYGHSSYGPDHEKQFEAVVLVNGLKCGRGTGTNKKAAEQQAAAAALVLLEVT